VRKRETTTLKKTAVPTRTKGCGSQKASGNGRERAKRKGKRRERSERRAETVTGRYTKDDET
jgi:hypothetical protein